MHRRTLAALALAALAVAGCGGSTTGNAPGTSAPPTTDVNDLGSYGHVPGEIRRFTHHGRALDVTYRTFDCEDADGFTFRYALDGARELVAIDDLVAITTDPPCQDPAMREHVITIPAVGSRQASDAAALANFGIVHATVSQMKPIGNSLDVRYTVEYCGNLDGLAVSAARAGTKEIVSVDGLARIGPDATCDALTTTRDTIRIPALSGATSFSAASG